MSRRAVIYCRISRDRVGAGLGVERQEQDCRALADQLGWTVVATHVDNDLSAYSGKRRPGYQALLADLEAQTATAVLAWHTDRLHRSPTELEAFIDVCERRHVITRTVTAGELDLASASGRMVARMLGAAARHETEHQAERSRRKKLDQAERGAFKGGRRPFGYAADGRTIVAAEAAEVLGATRAVLAGASLRSIAADLNARSVPTSTGGRWSSASIGDVLRRPRNAALMQHQGEIVGRADWPPLVEQGEWTSLRAVLDNPARRTAPPPGRRWLGTGLYRCGVCDETAIATTPGRGGTAYRCRSRAHFSRNAEYVDEFVTELVLRRLEQPDAALEQTASGNDAANVQATILAVRAQLLELAELFAVRAIDGAQFGTASKALHAELEQAEIVLGSTRGGAVLAGLAGSPDIRTRWPALTLDRRRATIAALCVVRLEPATRRGRYPGGGYFDPRSVSINWTAVQ